MIKAKDGDIFVFSYKEGSVSPSDVEKNKKELLDLGVRSVWIKVLNRMNPAAEQIQIQKLYK
jgi:hypothetical protein